MLKKVLNFHFSFSYICGKGKYLIAFYFISCLLLASAYVWLIHFYVKGWLKTPQQNLDKSLAPTEAFTVVISVRNEEDNIENCLNSILKQNYPRQLYEIIVINDFSTDSTLKKISPFENRVKLIKLSEHLPQERANFPNKKTAITMAVNMAKNPLILCADGDCEYGENWMLSIEQFYKKYKKDFIAAPVDYIFDNTWLFNFLEMDLVAMMGVTAGSIGQKKPVMASGANMMFTKAVFKEVNGYEGNEEIPSGDDVFLMQKVFINNEKAVGFVKNTEAIAFTIAPHTFTEFLNQRIRWTSKSTNMIDVKVKVVLVFNYLFYLALFLNFFVLPFFNIAFLVFGVVMMVFKLIIDTLFFTNILAFFNKSKLLKWMLPIEILHIFYVSVMGVLALVGTYKWKGRTVKK